MAEEGRPWWKTSQVNGSPSLGLTQTPSKSNSVIKKPWDNSSVSVKKEPVNSYPPSPLRKPPAFSPMLSPGAKSAALPSPPKSVVKTELPDIKDEPMAYIERALVKGEFPRDFNWPLGKWEPVALQNHVKSETKANHYIPKPLTETELKMRFAAPSRPRVGPPPDWHYIYTRERYEPGRWARAWWNANVERALNKRRDAYLQTKLNDNAPVEVRMERIWAFEVAKDEVRRVIAESKWKAAAREGGNTQDSDAVNVGASTSRDTGCTPANRTLSIQDRLGHIPMVGDVEDGKKEESEESPPTEEMEKTHPDEIQFIPHDKENVEVLTLEEEIEDAMTNSEDDSSDIRIDGEPGSNEVIFIQKKQGEVTFLAQVDGRVIKMNRKRKLCVTVTNTLNAKRNRVVALDTESEELTDSTENEETDSVLMRDVSETVDVTKEQGDETKSVGDTCCNTNDSQSMALQESSDVETAVKSLFQDENKQESNLSVASENVMVNTSVAENKGFVGAQPLQRHITADILTEDESKDFETGDIEEVALSDDEPEFIGSASQKVPSKDEEAGTPDKPKVDVEVVPDEVGVSDTQDADLQCIKEDIVFLETVKSVRTRVPSIPADGDLSREPFKREEKYAEFVVTDVTEEADNYENEKEETTGENRLEEDYDLKEDLVEVHGSPTSEKIKSKGSKSTVETFCDPEADVCEISSYVTGKEKTNMEKKASDLDEDILELDVSEEELVEKSVDSSECDMGDSTVEECEKDKNMLDDKDESSLGNQFDKNSFGEESNSCDVEVVEVDEEVEIVRENLTPQKNNTHKTRQMQPRVSKNTEQETGMRSRSSARHKAGGDSDTRVTRRSAIISEKKQHSPKKETGGHSSFNTGVRTRSRKH